MRSSSGISFPVVVAIATSAFGCAGRAPPPVTGLSRSTSISVLGVVRYGQASEEWSSTIGPILGRAFERRGDCSVAYGQAMERAEPQLFADMAHEVTDEAIAELSNHALGETVLIVDIDTENEAAQPGSMPTESLTVPKPPHSGEQGNGQSNGSHGSREHREQPSDPMGLRCPPDKPMCHFGNGGTAASHTLKIEALFYSVAKHAYVDAKVFEVEGANDDTSDDAILNVFADGLRQTLMGKACMPWRFASAAARYASAPAIP